MSRPITSQEQIWWQNFLKQLRNMPKSLELVVRDGQIELHVSQEEDHDSDLDTLIDSAVAPQIIVLRQE